MDDRAKSSRKRCRFRDGLARSSRKRCRSRDDLAQFASNSTRRKRGSCKCERTATSKAYPKHDQKHSLCRTSYQHPRRAGWLVVAELSENRDEDNWEDHNPQAEEEDIEGQVEKIRLRRQEILEKNKKQEQSVARSLDMDMVVMEYANVPWPASSSSAGDTQLPLEENGSVVSGYTYINDSMIPRLETCAKLADFIFGESPAWDQKLVQEDDRPPASETRGLGDNWDDAQGYYCHRIGEVLDSRYEVAALHGRGVFSSVVRARALKRCRLDVEEVAIKIIRNNDIMRKSGQQELNILKKLDAADPENKRHCVRFLTSCGYRNHLCLVFESLHMSLREVLKKFGTGLNLGAVRVYAKQLFIALKHLRNCGVLHCDVKPDNMLVNKGKNVLKLCDFGCAAVPRDRDNVITPYLVSRFYRAPEIILGLRYDHALDMWSAGCCLYEFFTGKVLFSGATNSDMLRLHMELKGPFPKKMLKKACFASEHFDREYNFCAVEADPVTKTNIKRVLVDIKPKGIASIVAGGGTSDEKMLGSFKDLLDKILMLDPDKRLTVSQALSHPFITGK